MTAKVMVIGVVELGDGKELRFVREGDDWRADLVVDRLEMTVGAPPECFEPSRETLDALDAAMLGMAEEAIRS